VGTSLFTGAYPGSNPSRKESVPVVKMEKNLPQINANAPKSQTPNKFLWLCLCHNMITTEVSTAEAKCQQIRLSEFNN